MNEGLMYTREDYDMDCWADQKKRTWLGFYLAWLRWLFWYSVIAKWQAWKCKRKGHDWEITDTGGPEYGPRIYAECKRCGKLEGPSYYG